MRALPRLSIRSVLSILFIVFVSSYAFFEASTLVEGPEIVITLPKETHTDSALITLSGNTKNANKLALLGKTIPMNEEGSFREQLLVPPGYSILTIEAWDRFGRSTMKTINVVRAENETSSFPSLLTASSSTTTTP